MFDTTALRPGARYLVCHQSPSQHYPRLSLMGYMSLPYHALSAGQWDARPAAGTRVLPWTDVRWVREVKPGARIGGVTAFVNRDGRGPMTASGDVFAGPRIDVSP